VLAHFPQGIARDAELAMSAAQAAFPKWSAMRWQDRVALVRRAAAKIEERLYELAVVTTLNVGKNRLESLGDIQEAADLLRAACDAMEKNNGYVVKMGSEPLPGHTVHNLSVMKPYGAWLIISPFNFPSFPDLRAGGCGAGGG